MAEAVNPIEKSAMGQLLRWIDGIDLPMFLMQLMPNGRLEYSHMNAALCRTTDTDAAFFKGKTISEVFPARTAEQLNRNCQDCLNSDMPVSYEECLLIETRETWWQTTLSKPAGFDGRVILGVAVSNTDQKNREFAAAETVSELTARFDELHLFSTMAAHDARSPLATVSSLVDLVLDGFEDMGDGKVELLRLISNTVDEALAQITGTLERSREMSSNVSRRTEVDLVRLTNDIAAMVDPEMALRIEVDAARVECDEVVVQMALRNLMANAARFARGRIAISLKGDASGQRLYIDVADDGPGLPDNTRIQDLCHEGEQREGSHGFGLRSISQLLKSRGGSLELGPSRPEAGLTGALFRVEFPGRILGETAANPKDQEWAVAS